MVFFTGTVNPHISAAGCNRNSQAANRAIELAVAWRTSCRGLLQTYQRGGVPQARHRVKENSGNFGYIAQTGEFGDMMEMGFVEPAKVVRVALQNADSVAGLMITT